MRIGKKIADRRKELQITQEELAERLQVSTQAVSRWENEWNLPDLEKIKAIAETLKTGVSSLLEEDTTVYNWKVRDQMFSDAHMFTRLKTIAEMQDLRETYKALYYSREKHQGQFRYKQKFSDVMIPYLDHPLMMACHAQSMGIGEDALLAVILLHDVCEDCGVQPDELPFSEEVRTAVDLLTKKAAAGISKEEATAQYYAAIRENRIASMAKVIDRCNNVSTMALSFSDAKLTAYIEETENYVMPLLTSIKQRCPEYNNAIFLIKYQMLSVLESLKAMLLGR